MRQSRPRVLVLVHEKGLGEVIFRGLSGIRGVELDVELTLSEDAARRLLTDRHYDLLVVGSENGLLKGPLLDSLPAGLPAVAVGGSPDERAVAVPLPLSLRLLERAVRRVLFGEDDRFAGPARRRDSVG